MKKMWWVRILHGCPVYGNRHGSSSWNVPPERYDWREAGKVIDTHPLVWHKKQENQGIELLDWKELSESDIAAHEGNSSGD